MGRVVWAPLSRPRTTWRSRFPPSKETRPVTAAINTRSHGQRAPPPTRLTGPLPTLPPLASGVQTLRHRHRLHTGDVVRGVSWGSVLRWAERARGADKLR